MIYQEAKKGDQSLYEVAFGFEVDESQNKRKKALKVSSVVVGFSLSFLGHKMGPLLPLLV